MIPKGAILQSSDQWLPARQGLATTSRQDDIIARLKKGEWGKAAVDYAIEIVAQRLCNHSVERYVTAAMQRGLDLEPEARREWEAATGLMADAAALVTHPDLDWGSTPDGWIGDDALLELKVPQIHTHVRYCLDGVVPAQYVPQLVGQQCVTGRRLTYFASYCPEMPEGTRLFMREFSATDEQVETVTAATREFLARVDDMFIEFTHKKG
jgi:hypothetical protein